jgi:uncharacterized OB-fold protein
MEPLVVSHCPSCAWQGFPVRLWCPACGIETVEATVDEGVIEDETTLVHAAGRTLETAVLLGTVRLRGGGQVIARIEGAKIGDDVCIGTVDRAPTARAARSN